MCGAAIAVTGGPAYSAGVDSPFDFPALRVQQPAKMLANRAVYEIFNAQQQLLAVATETGAHTRLQRPGKPVPGTRVLAVTTAAGEPLLTLIKHAREWTTDLQGPGGELTGQIRTGSTRRTYTLLDGSGQIAGRAASDLALKQFLVTGAAGGEFARVRKSRARLAKEIFTSSDHYQVEFTGPCPPPVRVLTAMLPIVVDLTLYGPF